MMARTGGLGEIVGMAGPYRVVVCLVGMHVPDVLAGDPQIW